MRVFSAFSGIGGFDLALERAGHEIIGHSEVDKYADSLYSLHFNNKNYGDITKIQAEDLPDFDMLVGGFPCQSFSIAGKRNGFNDTRGTLFFELARIAREKQPRLLLFENVKGLLSHNQGETFFTIISTLDEMGYDCQWQVLNSKNHGVPQNRERVFIVGHLRGTSRPEVFPMQGVGEICERSCSDKETICQTLTARYPMSWNGNYILRDGRDNRSCLRAGRTTELGIKGLSIRRLTPIECERLQSFPDNWTEGISDAQRYKCLGNAVTVNVIECILKFIK